MQAIIAWSIPYLTLVLCLLASNAGAQVADNNDTAVYPVYVINDLDLADHYEFTIKLKPAAKAHILLLQPWGTQTTYALYKNSIYDEPFAKVDMTIGNGPGLMDVSELGPGQHLMWLSACGNGGTFTLNIK